MKIGIVGGMGRMGRWFEEFFLSIGHEVLVSDMQTAYSAKDIAEMCEIVMLAVPMEVFPDVVRELGPFMSEDAFLTDICSLKEKQVLCMMEHTVCSVAGTHPLFGPGESEMKGRRIALCPGRGQKWLDWWEAMLVENGALCVRYTPAEHDRTMAWVQALNHFILMCLGMSIDEEGIEFKNLMHLATPSFERQLDILARLSMQDPELYATIQMDNPYSESVINSFIKHGDILRDIIVSKDRSSFVSMFEEVQAFGPALLKYSREK